MSKIFINDYFLQFWNAAVWEIYYIKILHCLYYYSLSVSLVYDSMGVFQIKWCVRKLKSINACCYAISVLVFYFFP